MPVQFQILLDPDCFLEKNVVKLLLTWSCKNTFPNTDSKRMCVCMCVHEHVCVYTYSKCMSHGGQRLTPAYILKQHLSLNLELTNQLDWLASESPTPTLGLPISAPQYWSYSCELSHPAFMCVLKNPHSSPHTYTAGTIPKDPSSQPSERELKKQQGQ